MFECDGVGLYEANFRDNCQFQNFRLYKPTSSRVNSYYIILIQDAQLQHLVAQSLSLLILDVGHSALSYLRTMEEPQTPRPRLRRSRKMTDVDGSPPVTPQKSVEKHPKRCLQMKVSDASHLADKGTPPGTPVSQATTLVLGGINDLTPSPKKVLKSPKTPGAPLRKAKKVEVSKKNPKKPPTPEPSESSDSESSEEESLGSLESPVPAADTESDTDLSKHERLKQRKAALYLDWRDYYSHQKSFGQNIDVESLEVYTHDGLISAGWVQDAAGRWNKPGARAVTLKRPAAAKPAPERFVLRFSKKKGQGSSKKKNQKSKKDKKGKVFKSMKSKAMKVKKTIVKTKNATKASSSKPSSSGSKAQTKSKSSKASSSGQKVKNVKI